MEVKVIGTSILLLGSSVVWMLMSFRIGEMWAFIFVFAMSFVIALFGSVQIELIKK